MSAMSTRRPTDANECARKLADENARTFKCGKDKRIISGKVGDLDMPDENEMPAPRLQNSRL